MFPTWAPWRTDIVDRLQYLVWPTPAPPVREHDGGSATVLAEAREQYRDDSPYVGVERGLVAPSPRQGPPYRSAGSQPQERTPSMYAVILGFGP